MQLLVLQMVRPVCRTQSEHLPAPLLHPALPQMPAQEVPGSESKGTEPPVPSETPPTPGRVCFGAAIDMDLETHISPRHVDLHSWCHKQLLPHAIGTSTCTPNLISAAVYGTHSPQTRALLAPSMCQVVRDQRGTDHAIQRYGWSSKLCPCSFSGLHVSMGLFLLRWEGFSQRWYPTYSPKEFPGCLLTKALVK